MNCIVRSEILKAFTITNFNIHLRSMRKFTDSFFTSSKGLCYLLLRSQILQFASSLKSTSQIQINTIIYILLPNVSQMNWKTFMFWIPKGKQNSYKYEYIKIHTENFHFHFCFPVLDLMHRGCLSIFGLILKTYFLVCYLAYLALT